ncbi:MAG: metallophosphoesterase [Bryobacteraceae bacterium]
MKLLIFSDIHSDLKALERVMAIEADYYIAAGDLVNFGRGLDRCGELMRHSADRVWVMPGNNESAAQIEDFCRDFGFHNFHETSMQVDGYHIAGLGYSNPTPFGTPGEYTEAEIAARLKPFATLDPLVLICHCPPIDTPLDEARGGHFGSTAVREFLEQYPPVWFFCGHIHEAEGVAADLGPTRGINVGKRGYLLELKKV